jgi:hypothetical protein
VERAQAEFDAEARLLAENVLASSDSMKGASNILNADRDRYMMTESQVKKKWVALSLIESMLLDTLVLANFEYYSCSPRRFQLLGSLEYPTKRWALLGDFEANDTRAEQSFEIPQPMYVRYLKLRFLTHYGAQHYWSVSAVRAYGQTVVDKYQADWERVQEAKNAVADATQLQLEAQKEAHAEGGEAVEAAEATELPTEFVAVTVKM